MVVVVGEGKVLVDFTVVSEEGVTEVGEVDAVAPELPEVGASLWAIPGLITVKKTTTKTIARINRTIPTIIPMASGLLVAQSNANFSFGPGCGTEFISFYLI